MINCIFNWLHQISNINIYFIIYCCSMCKWMMQQLNESLRCQQLFRSESSNVSIKFTLQQRSEKKRRSSIFCKLLIRVDDLKLARKKRQGGEINKSTAQMKKSILIRFHMLIQLITRLTNHLEDRKENTTGNISTLVWWLLLTLKCEHVRCTHYTTPSHTHTQRKKIKLECIFL